jgi:hypothetical protein
MTYEQVIDVLKMLKRESEILDYNIESDFATKGRELYVKTKLVVFNRDGKPTVTTGLTGGEGEIEDMQKRALVAAYEQNPVISDAENCLTGII